MMDWMVEAEDVACGVEDMKEMAWMACSSCCVQREGEGRTMMEDRNRWEGRELKADGACLTRGRVMLPGAACTHSGHITLLTINVITPCINHVQSNCASSYRLLLKSTLNSRMGPAEEVELAEGSRWSL